MLALGAGGFELVHLGWARCVEGTQGQSIAEQNRIFGLAHRMK